MFVSPSFGGVTLLSLQLHMRVRMFVCVYQVVGALFFFFLVVKLPPLTLIPLFRLNLLVFSA